MMKATAKPVTMMVEAEDSEDAAFVAPADGSGEAAGWKEYGFADPLPY